MDGSIDGSVDLERRVTQDSHPYAPSFGLCMRFSSIIPTSGASFKYKIAEEGKVRNRKIVSEKQPKKWLDSFQTKALLPPPPAKMPHHNAASGYIGSIDSEFLSQSSFFIPQALTRPRGRRLKSYDLLEPCAQIDDRWLKNPMEKLAKKVLAMTH